MEPEKAHREVRERQPGSKTLVLNLWRATGEDYDRAKVCMETKKITNVQAMRVMAVENYLINLLIRVFQHVGNFLWPTTVSPQLHLEALLSCVRSKFV